MDVMVLESELQAAVDVTRTLVGAGHAVYRCHDPEGPPFPCYGIVEPERCPLEVGVDAMVVVRRRVTPRPTRLENGVSCAIRAGLPVVAAGPAALDPYERWIDARSDGSIVDALERGIDHADDALRRRIRECTDRWLAEQGADPATVEYRFERQGKGLRVVVNGATLTPMLGRALAVRLVSLIGETAPRFERIDVSVEHTASVGCAEL